MDENVVATSDSPAPPSGLDTKEPAFDKQSFLDVMRERAAHSVDGWNDIHTKSLEDVRFYAGDQWPEKVKAERDEDERPMLTLNQLPKFVAQVIGDARQNKMQIKVKPVEGNMNVLYPNVAGNVDFTASQILEGVVRHIEYNSKAEHAYDMALQHAVTGSIGFLRVIKRWAIPYGFEQELAIRCVRNPYSVLFDPSAMFSDEPHLGAADYCFVHTLMKRKDAEARWPGKSFGDLGLDATNPAVRWWLVQDDTRIAEYWYREKKPTTYVRLNDGSIYDIETLAERQQELMARGLTVVDQKDGEKICVYMALVSGTDILEGPYKWDGAYIPIVPVTGPEVIVDGKPQYWGLIRHSIDAQRMYNYWRTAATEAVALAPKAPFTAAAQTVAGRESEWKNANRKPSGVLIYNWYPDVPPPRREAPANNPAAEINQSLQANDDIKSTLGMFDASIGQRSNETSGRAILARQREGDVGTFIYHDNLAKAVEQIGRIIVDLAPKVYDTQRQLRIMLPENQEDFVQVNLADLGTARFDVAVSTGPAFTTRRVEAAEMMMEMVKSAPELAQHVMDLVVEYMDWPGSEVIKERLKKLVPPQLLSAKEAAERARQDQVNPPPPPSPQELAAMKAETDSAEAEVISAHASKIAATAQLAEATSMQPEAIREMIAQGIAEVMQEMAVHRGNGRAQ